MKRMVVGNLAPHSTSKRSNTSLKGICTFLLCFSCLSFQNAFATTWSLDGTLTIYDNNGGVFTFDDGVFGTMDYDMNSGLGDAYITTENDFEGSKWEGHDISLTRRDDGLIEADALLDLGNLVTNFPFSFVFEMVDNNDGTFKFFTPDLDNNGQLGVGITGLPLLLRSFNGYAPSFELVATPDLASVPVPAAVWLFATGLVGLAGFKRKRSPK